LIQKATGIGRSVADAKTWDAEYANGNWEELYSFHEQAHYQMLILYIVSLSQTPTILDVGCGEGILARKLRPEGYKLYVGIDLSEAAIAKGKCAESELTRFLVADAEQYAPEHKFDVIVFNESLYYFSEPDVVLERYRSHLTNNGVCLLSLFRRPKADAIRTYVKGRFTVVDETLVQNARGSWSCIAIR